MDESNKNNENTTNESELSAILKSMEELKKQLEDIKAEKESYKEENDKLKSEQESLKKDLADTKKLNFTLARTQSQQKTMKPEEIIDGILFPERKK